MKNVEIGMKVNAYKGSCIGVKIQSTTWYGEIIKVNKNSIRVRFTEEVCKYGDKETWHNTNMNVERTYRFSKALSNGNDYYVSAESKAIYGGIEL